MQILKTISPIHINELEKALPFYEEMLQTKVGTKFYSADKNLEIAVVGPLLLISGNDEALSVILDIAVSFLVNDIHAIMECVTKVPTGYNMIVQQPTRWYSSRIC